MKLSNLFETRNPGYKAGEPYWQLDAENRIYTVHLPDNTEVARFEFQYIWDSSPALRQAKEAYKKIYSEYYNKKKADADAVAQHKPLSQLEQEYLDKSRKLRQYINSYKMVDDETRAVYDDHMKKWSARLDQLSASGIIRKSVIMGTYQVP